MTDESPTKKKPSKKSRPSSGSSSGKSPKSKSKSKDGSRSRSRGGGSSSEKKKKGQGGGRDLFPRLDLTVAEDSSSNPAENNSGRSARSVDSTDTVQRRINYECKEDEDVAVFMALANRMNFKSLIFILQGHAREQNLPNNHEALQQQAVELSGQSPSSMSGSNSNLDAGPSHVPKVKQFRFAEVSGGEVRCVVHEIESYKDHHHLWWSDEESGEQRGSAIKDVRHYQKYKLDYIKMIEELATEGCANQHHHDEMTKKLANEAYPRGLEVHIVTLLDELRNEAINAVLDVQDDGTAAGASFEEIEKLMAKKSREYSRDSMRLAGQLADCDHIVALKASLSKWAPPPSPKKKPPKPVQRKLVNGLKNFHVSQQATAQSA